MTLAIGLPLRNQAALTELLRQIQDPSSQNYRQYLTPAQFAARFGPREEDYEAVAAFAKAHGLTVTNRYPNRVVLDVDGAVADIENALHVTMRVYQHPSEARTFYAPDTEPSVDLAVSISHIDGLDNYEMPKPSFRRLPMTRAAGAEPSVGSGPGQTYMGNDFRSAYVPGVALTGSGQTVGLLEFDGYTASDITYYETLAGLPNVTLTDVLLDSFNGTPSSLDGQTEVSLDIDMDISMAPGVSQVIVYEAGPAGNFDDVLNRMVSDNLAKQLSSSWTVSHKGDDPTADSDFQEMATQGQSFYQASGDTDAYTRSIPFPVDNPYMTAVGGTTLTDGGTGGAWVSETAWNWGFDSNAGEYVGTSGGISTRYSIPTWQQGISMTANQGSTSKRNVPDVALTADNVYVRVDGSDNDVGGTSCAAPLWAAFTALVNQQAVANGESTVGFINPAVYSIGKGSSYATDFHDITTGNSFSSSSPSKFSAVTGYDLCTGWGTPAGAALINALAPLPENLEVSSTAAFASSGPLGGPFAPSSMSYTLINPGDAPLTWSASATQSWLSLSATSGTLAASGSTTVTASINAKANALASGTYTDTVTITDITTDYTQAGPVSLVVQTPYETWQSKEFTSAELANPAISGVTATPAGDGIPNLIKYALNLNPFTDGVSGLPVGSVATTGSGNYLRLTYTEVQSATDITYTPQVSMDLVTWNSGPGYTTTTGTTSNPGGLTESVTVQAVTPVNNSTPAQFIRLQVTTP
jgi:subtilase family serine protease